MAEKELAHKIGEDVYAKWPGSKFWYRAKILNNKGHYKVEFEDGSIDSVNAKQVRGLSSFRQSPSRGASPGRRPRTPAASPGRRKGRSRSKSPTQTVKSRPKSRSPGRTGKGKQPTTPKRSPSRQSPRVVAQQSLEKEKPVEVKKSEITTVEDQPLLSRLSSLKLFKPFTSTFSTTVTVESLEEKSQIPKYETEEPTFLPIIPSFSRSTTVQELEERSLKSRFEAEPLITQVSTNEPLRSFTSSISRSSTIQPVGSESNMHVRYLAGTRTQSVFDQQSISVTQSSGTSAFGRGSQTFTSSNIAEKEGVATFQQDWKQDMNSKSSKSGKVSKTSETEFGGPIGAFFLIIFLPAIVLLTTLACTKSSCSVAKLPHLPSKFGNYFDLQIVLLLLGFFIIQAVLSLVPVGKVVEGQILRTGQRLSYRCNGFIIFVLTISICGAACYFGHPIIYNYDNFLKLAVSSIIFSFILSIYLYIKARKAPNNALSSGGNTGNVIYDFFMGHELNPRIGSFDFKFFCELRPALIGWALVNLAIIAKNYEENNGKPNPALLLVAGSQIFYIADSLWFEEALLTTMDIIHEGFGFMLAFGDLVWVPFIFTLQPRYLHEHQQTYSYLSLTLFFLVILIGYIIFRGSNSQKNAFRKNPFDPALAHLKTIPTAIGKPLLASGWWGFVRHPNYLGDIIIALGWCICCGFNHVLPYFYVTYLLILIIHRALRDERQCKKKYGLAWDRYCEHVKYRIIPYVF